MTSITISDILTIIFVLVDDWYQAEGVRLLRGKPGKKPTFSDSEMMTLMLAQDYIPYPSETQYIEFIRANHLDMFPKLIDQSQYNRRARALRLLVEQLRRYWIIQKGWDRQTCYLMDTKPVPVLGYKRNKRRSDFLGKAGYGVCVSRNLKYFGFKLVAISTMKGVPVLYDLVPANSDERLAAEAIIDQLSGCDLFTDKGFIGLEWQTRIFDQTNNLIWTPRRSNQYLKNTRSLDRWLSSVRERIEGVFHEIQNTGRNIERLLTKTVLGLCTRVIAKMTSHLLRHLLLIDFGVNVQTFETVSAF
jgi:Transposase DDE domain